MLAAKNLRVIGRPGVGVDDVDVAAATELGIPVVIVPEANTRSVAEHALGMMFACAKEMLYSDARTRRGEFSVRSRFKAFELFGKTLGLVGYGNIGRELARLSTAIGMKVVVYDPFISPASIQQEGYQYEGELSELLAKADVVSLHVPLTEKTRNLIGQAELKLMKPTAVLINCARGGVVDEEALRDALENNRIHSAGLDVCAIEPVRSDDPLTKLENIIITPHMAGQTKEAAAGVAIGAAEGVLAVLNGQRWPYIANKAVYDHPRWNSK
jgi:D-3-phosphoglycerate dehydrogenase